MKRAGKEIDEAFAQLMRDHQRSVFALAYGKLRNVHDAEDVAQEVFIEAFRKAPKLKKMDNVSAWLFKATIFRCKDHIRKMSRRERRELKYTSSARASVEMQFESENPNGVLAAICLLPEKYRLPLILRHFAELSYAEISGITGLSETAVDTRLRAAKRKLKEQLVDKDKGADRQ